jgi:Protein of unknown function (DUF2846)
MMRPIIGSIGKQCFSMALFVAMLLVLGGCATSGPTYTEFKPTAPRLEAGNGRIYLYRASVLGAAVQPAIKVNNDVVGAAQPLGFFYVDRKPGAYEISTTTEVERKLSLTLDAGQTRYVRLNISIGFFVGHVYPELVDNDVGEKEMQECHYTGSTGGSKP